ncbi:MAG: hypothetical protein WD052_00325 [Bacteroidales bacterium]
MIYFKILEEKRLVVMVFKGVITPADVMDFIDSLLQLDAFDPEYSDIIDLRSADMSYDYDGLRSTLHFMATTKGFAAKRKSAYITSNSKQVVPPMLMKSGAFDLPMEVEVMSTVESCLEWLDITGFTPADYEEILKELQVEV